jgi:hypothetical protein
VEREPAQGSEQFVGFVDWIGIGFWVLSVVVDWGSDMLVAFPRWTVSVIFVWYVVIVCRVWARVLDSWS